MKGCDDAVVTALVRRTARGCRARSRMVAHQIPRVRSLGAAVGVFTLLAGLLGVLADVLIRFAANVSLLVPVYPTMQFVTWYFDNRYILPLVVGILGLVLLAFPVRARRGEGVAELAPRGLFRFTSARWLIAPVAVFALILLITLIAGSASQPDPATRRYDMYIVEITPENTMATAIYGWYYSVPALVATALMAATAAGTLALIARPPLSQDRDLDSQIRARRSRNVITVTTGALLLHLGLILQSLAGTASLAASMPSELGRITLSTPVAAMMPVLTVASYVAAALGVALWATVALTAVGVRQRERVVAGS
ncbi:hypothetical protein [Microbacterium sp. NPDC056569]|uniref:hypothetical protein n=1 Tax=Microbacterium sp. NPDC056569 TaxID=3345867 RepID=UPI00366F95DB